MGYTFTEMNEEDAREIIRWRYPEPYAVYTLDADTGNEAALMELLDQRSPHFAVRDTRGELVGFFALGSAAEVGVAGPPHLLLPDGGLSVGLGMRPDLTGQGRGPRFVAAGLTFARERFNPTYFRLFVLAFNARAIRAYERVGFREVGARTVTSAQGAREFIEMRREAE